jgi:ribosomal protein L11 methyltransferase
MADTTWLEVSLTVDGELAEAVAEVLARFAPNGVVIESTAVTTRPDDSEGQVIGPLRVAAYLAADETLEEKRRQLEEALWYLGRIQPLPPAEMRLIQQTNWAEAWKQHYRPIAIGQRLLITPAWIDPPDASRIAIRIEPGMAFGTGTHPTTQLCLELIEAFHASQPYAHGWQTIDVGCGSGILAIAALKLGSRHALGVDIDPEAIDCALQNAQLNEVAPRLDLAVGSLANIRSGRFALRQADLVLANILAPVLVRLLDEGLGELLATRGWLVLSGILAEQSAQVEHAVQRNGLRLVERRLSGDWVALAAAA